MPTNNLVVRNFISPQSVPDTNAFRSLHINSPTLIDDDTFLGIEIELEGIQTRGDDEYLPRLSPYWQCKEDGSLRNGTEFVFAEPLRNINVKTALELLQLYLDTYEKTVRPIEVSDRCSVHVHMDVSTLTREELLNLILIYIYFERVIFEYISPERYKNIHCKPLVDSNFIDIFNSIKSCDISHIRQYIRDRADKYSAFNILSLLRFGTIEFRHHRGTKDVMSIIKWLNIILALKNAARLTKIEDILSDEDPIQYIFGNHLIVNGDDRVKYNDLLFKGKIDVEAYTSYISPKNPSRSATLKSRLKNFCAKKELEVKSKDQLSEATEYFIAESNRPMERERSGTFTVNSSSLRTIAFGGDTSVSGASIMANISANSIVTRGGNRVFWAPVTESVINGDTSAEDNDYPEDINDDVQPVRREDII